MTTSPAILCRLGRGFAELRLLGILGSSYPRSCISLPIGPVPSASALSSATPRFPRDRSGLLLSFRRIITSGKDYPPSGVVSHRAGAEPYSSTSSMLWVGSCGQFALDWFGLHSILVPPPGTMISCPTYSIFPGKRKSSSMHRNVLSTSFRSGSLAIFPLAVGGLFLALSMHELRLRRILRSSQRLEDSLGSWLSPKVRRGFIGAR